MAVKADEVVRLSFELVTPTEANRSWFDGYKQWATAMIKRLWADSDEPEWVDQEIDRYLCSLNTRLDFVDSHVFALCAACSENGIDLRRAKKTIKTVLLQQAKVGDVIRDRHLGGHRRVSFIYAECARCGTSRWVEYIVAKDEPKHSLCKTCASRDSSAYAREVKRRRNEHRSVEGIG